MGQGLLPPTQGLERLYNISKGHVMVNPIHHTPLMPYMEHPEAMHEQLFISEIFYSIQGESTRAGLPCLFIRLAGCNLRCSYCDACLYLAGTRTAMTHSRHLCQGGKNSRCSGGNHRWRAAHASRRLSAYAGPA
jgi:hypothetical protein